MSSHNIISTSLVTAFVLSIGSLASAAPNAEAAMGRAAFCSAVTTGASAKRTPSEPVAIVKAGGYRATTSDAARMPLIACAPAMRSHSGCL